MTTNPINRRAALVGAIAAIPGLPAAVASAKSSDALSSLIAKHRKANEAFTVMVDELEEAEPPEDAYVVGFAGHRHSLGNTEQAIVEEIDRQHEAHARVLRLLTRLSPETGAAALAVLQRERDAAVARVKEALAPFAEVEERWSAAYYAEDGALEAICAYRCKSLDEITRKFRYLATVFADIQPSEEQQEAIWISLVPEGETLAEA